MSFSLLYRFKFQPNHLHVRRLIAIKRAGADLIVSYYAEQLAKLLPPG
jgi:delta-aminolevulinic acid dehydratase/porphobilinogen synthase